MGKHGGARKGAGRKAGVGLSFDIKTHCELFIIELLKNEAIKQIRFIKVKPFATCIFAFKSFMQNALNFK